MDFNEWFYNVDDSGMNGFDRIIHCLSHEHDDVDAIAALMEKAYEAGVASGIDAAMDYL
jgi:hypothetical protein